MADPSGVINICVLPPVTSDLARLRDEANAVARRHRILANYLPCRRRRSRPADCTRIFARLDTIRPDGPSCRAQRLSLRCHQREFCAPFELSLPGDAPLRNHCGARPPTNTQAHHTPGMMVRKWCLTDLTCGVLRELT